MAKKIAILLSHVAVIHIGQKAPLTLKLLEVSYWRASMNDGNGREVVKTNDGVWLAIFSAWIIAMGSTLGALFIGEVMGQAPCDLCWHQRAFMFPLAVLLAVAAFRSDARAWIYAVPLAAVGWSIAAFHNLLYFNIIPTAIKPCGQGPSCSGAGMLLFGTLPIPLLSLGAFTLIIVLLLIVRRRTPA